MNVEFTEDELGAISFLKKVLFKASFQMHTRGREREMEREFDVQKIMRSREKRKIFETTKKRLCVGIFYYVFLSVSFNRYIYGRILLSHAAI